MLPAASQRRLARILRELDPNAVQKLLLWESVFKEEAEGGSSRRLNRLRMRVQATVKALDKQAVSGARVCKCARVCLCEHMGYASCSWLLCPLTSVPPPPFCPSPHSPPPQAASSGYRPPSEEYPDLPASVRAEGRRDRDMLAAKLEAEVVGRQFHRGSGDRPYVSMPTYPRFEGLTMEVSGEGGLGWMLLGCVSGGGVGGGEGAEGGRKGTAACGVWRWHMRVADRV